MLGGKEAATDIRRDQFPPEWREVFTFAIVRNPFDRLVSAYKMFRDKKFKRHPLYGSKKLTLELMLQLIEDEQKTVEGADLHARLKRHSIPMTDPYFGLQYVNYVARFEAFEKEWKRLCNILEIPLQPIPHCRASDPHDYRSYFTPELQREVERIFAKDLELYNYQF
jgi:hypothetical protein